MISFKQLLAIAILITASQAIQYSMDLTPNQRICFYQVFELNQKYSYVVFTGAKRQHQVEVSHIDGRQWKSIFYKKSENQVRTRVDKLASAATTYSFCVKNMEATQSTFKIEFNSGIEVMELHDLPDSNDAQNLERQLNWLEQQSNMLSERSSNIQGLRNINQQMANMVGKKLIIFGVLGLLAIAVVNFVFFRSLKKTFKDRKLI